MKSFWKKKQFRDFNPVDLVILLGFIKLFDHRMNPNFKHHDKYIGDKIFTEHTACGAFYPDMNSSYSDPSTLCKDQNPSVLHPLNVKCLKGDLPNVAPMAGPNGTL